MTKRTRTSGDADDSGGHVEEERPRRTALRGLKPPGMRALPYLERRILEAQRDGEFDDLPGRGKPDPALSKASDPLWWVKEMMARENLSGALPPALEIRRELEETLAGLERVRHIDKAREKLEKLNAEIRRLNAHAHSGPPTNLSPVDIDETLERWKQRREALDADRAQREAD